MQRRIRRLFLLVGIIALLLGGGFGFFHLFKVQNIIVEGAESVSGTEYVDGAFIF